MILDARDCLTYKELSAAVDERVVGNHQCADVIWVDARLAEDLDETYRKLERVHLDDGRMKMFKGIPMERWCSLGKEGAVVHFSGEEGKK